MSASKPSQGPGSDSQGRARTDTPQAREDLDARRLQAWQLLRRDLPRRERAPAPGVDTHPRRRAETPRQAQGSGRRRLLPASDARAVRGVLRGMGRALSGTGKRGFTESTRADYRRDLERYVVPRFGCLSVITPVHIEEFIASLCDEEMQGGISPTRRCAVSSPRSARACAQRCAGAWSVVTRRQGAVLPARDEQKRIAEGEDNLEDHDVKALTTEAPARHPRRGHRARRRGDPSTRSPCTPRRSWGTSSPQPSF